MKTLSSQAKIGLAGSVAVALLTVSGCGGGGGAPTTLPPAGIYFGQSTRVGGGSATGFATLGGDTKPTSVGVELNDGALQNLPTTDTEYLVELPFQVNETAFTFVVLAWHPNGHGPVGVYDKPHFDYRFYTIPNSQRASLTSPDPATPQANVVPSGFVAATPFVNGVGTRYDDSSAPEANGGTFTKALSYGFYNGSLTTFEPMVTHDLLLAKTNVSTTIKQPASFQKAGYYPTTFSVKYGAVNSSAPTDIQHILVLDGLVKH